MPPSRPWPARPRRAARRTGGRCRSRRWSRPRSTTRPTASTPPAAGPGGAGDFLTSPEVGPAVRRRAGPGPRRRGGSALGRPDPFVVVEAGAGPGTLARPVAWPSPRARRRCATCSSSGGAPSAGSTPSTSRLARAGAGAELDADAAPVAAAAPVRQPAELPAARDRRRAGQRAARQPAVPPRAAHRRAEWSRGRASTATTGRAAGRARGRVRVADAPRPRSAPPAAPRVPLQQAAAAWVADALGRRRAGPGAWSSTTPPPRAELARPARGSSGCAPTAATSRGGHPLDDPGTQDITVEVAVDQLAGRPATRVRTQAELPAGRTASTSWWTRAAGIWAERAHARRPRRPAGPQPRRARPRRCSTPTASVPSVAWSGTSSSSDPALEATCTGAALSLRTAGRPGSQEVPMSRARPSPTSPPRTGPSRRPPASRPRRWRPTDSLYDEADADYEAFWARQARELLTWCDDFDTDARVGAARSPSGSSAARSTSSYNCLDRHVDAGRGDQGRLPLGGRARRHPHHHLRRPARRGAAVRQRAARASASSKGDRVAIYMPMIPELPVAMLACTRIGAAHSVVFGGFSPDSLADRINDAEAQGASSPPTAASGAGRAVAAQAERRRGRWRSTPSVDRRGGRAPHRATTSTMVEGRDHWYHELMADGLARRARPSPWTARTCSSCSTPRAPRPSPRASCTPRAATSPRWPSPTSTCSTSSPTTDVYWCAADIGWVTGHSYIVYGPLANGATSVHLRGHARHARHATASGTSSSATASPCSTPRPPPSARS